MSSSRVAGQFPQPHPHAIHGGTDEQSAETQDVKILLRSGHTIRATIDKALIGEIRNHLNTPTGDTGWPRRSGTIDLPLGEVLIEEIIGVIGVDTTIYTS